jgi:hypothetical protein
MEMAEKNLVNCVCHSVDYKGLGQIKDIHDECLYFPFFSLLFVLGDFDHILGFESSLISRVPQFNSILLFLTF